MDEGQTQTVGQILTSKNPALAKQSKPKTGSCQCGASIESTEIAGRWFVSDKCKACAEIHKAQQAKHSLRQARKIKAARMRHSLGRVIPPLFASAHIRDLSKPFLAKVFEHRNHQGLLLWGSPGVGKTYAMAAMARYQILRGKKCRRVTFKKLCEEIQDSYSDPHRSVRKVKAPYEQCDCLFVEDIGISKPLGELETNFNVETFCDLIDTRSEDCLPTFITTNKSVENLGVSFDKRIASRLYSFKVVHVLGNDKRRPVK